jgi:hypothetical protein
MAYAVVDRLTSRATSTVRYTVALAALMLMPAVVIGTFVDELRVATQAHTTSDASFIPSAMHLGATPTPILHELPLASSLESNLEEQGNWLAMRADRMLPWLDALWLAGVLLLALR